jgi:hypothetical protein
LLDHFFIKNEHLTLLNLVSSASRAVRRVLTRIDAIGEITIMLSLPVELRLPVIRHIQDSIPSPLFEHNADEAIRTIQEFNKVLIALSLYHREWTAIAQSELFRNLYIQGPRKMKLLLELLRRSEEFKPYIKDSRSALLEGDLHWYDLSGIKYDLDELAAYCPNIEEVTCSCMSIQMTDFRTCAAPSSGNSRC